MTTSETTSELISRAYGTRAYLSDLQNRRSSGDMAPGLMQNIDLANREIERIDRHILALSCSDPHTAWQIFDTGKGTHVGPVQRLSQRLKETLPPQF